MFIMKFCFFLTYFKNKIELGMIFAKHYIKKDTENKNHVSKRQNK